MKTAFISDIHANLEALEAVLADIQAQGVDRVYCLGDVVGYGPDPNLCVARVREVCKATVIGNHDWAALGRMDTIAFNEYARAAADWTSNSLDGVSREFLSNLPLELLVDDTIRLVHASPLEPERWTYVLSFLEAARQFESFSERLCFIGHSHLPIVIQEKGNGHDLDAREYPGQGPLKLLPEARYIVNVGSVGQPRDRDPRAAYVWYDDEEDSLLLRRLEYQVPMVQAKIRASGLPDFLAQRLAEGV